MNAETIFKSPKSREAIRTRYAQILNAFPFTQRYVETSLGKTFLLEAGNPQAPALILLHGSCSNSAFWFGEISALCGRYHVLAADIPGEAGNSAENRPVLASDGYARWLMDVLTACGIEKAIVMGNSLGSWLALKFAVRYPERVSKLILIAPSGLAGQNDAFLEETRRMQRRGETLAPDAAVTGETGLPAEVLAFINLITAGYRPITEALPVYTDEQLKRLTMPVLFIAGEQDALLDAPAAAQRLSRILPGAEIQLLANTGHTVVDALAYVVPFLGNH